MTTNPIFKDVSVLPEQKRQVTVVFKDKEISSNVLYCQNHKKWHSPYGDLRVSKIHQWAYTDELYPQLNLPEIEKELDSDAELKAKQILKMLLISAMLSGKSSKSDLSGFPFNI